MAVVSKRWLRTSKQSANNDDTAYNFVAFNKKQSKVYMFESYMRFDVVFGSRFWVDDESGDGGGVEESNVLRSG